MAEGVFPVANVCPFSFSYGAFPAATNAIVAPVLVVFRTCVTGDPPTWPDRLSEVASTWSVWALTAPTDRKSKRRLKTMIRFNALPPQNKRLLKTKMKASVADEVHSPFQRMFSLKTRLAGMHSRQLTAWFGASGSSGNCKSEATRHTGCVTRSVP